MEKIWELRGLGVMNCDIPLRVVALYSFGCIICFEVLKPTVLMYFFKSHFCKNQEVCSDFFKNSSFFHILFLVWLI